MKLVMVSISSRNEGTRSKSTLEKMRAKEDQAKKLPKVAGEEGRQVGKGAIEGWRHKLTERQLEIVEEFAGDTLARLGYPGSLSSHSAERKPVGELRPDLPSIRVLPARTNTAGSRPLDSAVKRAFRIRVGGQIANFFCWYQY